MLLNYIKLSLRLLARNPFFTFINVLGLSVGFAVFFLLWPFAQSELQSDLFIKDHEKIKRIVLDFGWTEDGGKSWGHVMIASGPSFIVNDLALNTPVTEFTRFIGQDNFYETATGLNSLIVISRPDSAENNSYFRVENAISADENFLDFFDIPFLYGDRTTALRLPESIVLSDKAAHTYFGNANPLGKLLRANKSTYVVTGVFRDPPSNTHLVFDMVFSNAAKLGVWNPIELRTPWLHSYVKTSLAADEVAAIINARSKTYPGDYQNPNIRVLAEAQPLTDVAFTANYANESFVPKSRLTLTLLASVSLVVLIMAWINYVNLSISKTRTRFKEIAARKVSGAKLTDLLAQFICHSAMINLIAILAGLTLIQLVRQPFADFFNIRFVPSSGTDIGTNLFIAGALLTGVVLTAVYPAVEAMNYSTRQLISKHQVASKRLIPSVLTTFQYVAALTLVIWAFIVYSQLDHILAKGIGLDTEQLITIEAPLFESNDNWRAMLSGYVNEVKTLPGVEDAMITYSTVGGWGMNLHTRKVGADMFYGMDSQGGVDENYIPIQKIKILAGRNFVKDEPGNSVIISKYASERLGFKTPADAVGSRIEVSLNGVDKFLPVEIVGVIADYRTHSWHSTKNEREDVSGRGIFLSYLNNVFPFIVPRTIALRVNTSQLDELISGAERRYKESFPGNVFRWRFLSDLLNQRYDQQKVIRNQLVFFTLLAVSVACMGLLGMMSNKVMEKTKEIGIRKVLGAGMHQIGSLLLNTTAKQLLISILIGIPLAWKLSTQYLEAFTDQISVSWWHYALPLTLLTIIMIATVGTVLFKASRTNPVEALKHD